MQIHTSCTDAMPNRSQSNGPGREEPCLQVSQRAQLDGRPAFCGGDFLCHLERKNIWFCLGFFIFGFISLDLSIWMYSSWDFFVCGVEVIHYWRTMSDFAELHLPRYWDGKLSSEWIPVWEGWFLTLFTLETYCLQGIWSSPCKDSLSISSFYGFPLCLQNWAPQRDVKPVWWVFHQCFHLFLLSEHRVKKTMSRN